MEGEIENKGTNNKKKEMTTERQKRKVKEK